MSEVLFDPLWQMKLAIEAGSRIGLKSRVIIAQLTWLPRRMLLDIDWLELRLLCLMHVWSVKSDFMIFFWLHNLNKI